MITQNLKSDFIFTLAEKYDIQFNAEKGFVFLDEAYEGFKNEYISLANSRDTHLINYLKSTPNFYRTFLPYDENVFRTAFQIQWYYDEIIIYDPIIFQLQIPDESNIENKKHRLVRFLKFLNAFRESITEGFIIFANYDSLKNQQQEANNEKIQLLVQDNDVRDQLDTLVKVFKMETTQGKAIGNFNVRSFYRSKSTFFPVMNTPQQDENGMFYVDYDFVGSTHSLLSLEEIKKLNIYERVYKEYTNDYKKEVSEILNHLIVGALINAPVLYSRSVDAIVMNKLGEVISANNITNKSFEITLPFVDNISPEKLLELRLKIPSAFLDFRNTMVELIFELQKQKIEGQIFEVKVQQKINPMLKKLDAEMKTSIQKAKIQGIITPAISAIGAFALWKLGFDISKLTSILFGGTGVATEMNVIIKRLEDINNAKANPLYFLWKVKNSK